MTSDETRLRRGSLLALTPSAAPVQSPTTWFAKIFARTQSTVFCHMTRIAGGGPVELYHYRVSGGIVRRLGLDYSYDKMWEIDPVDLWTAAALLVGYSLPFLALEIEFKLQELKQRATDREIQKAILRRLTGHD